MKLEKIKKNLKEAYIKRHPHINNIFVVVITTKFNEIIEKEFNSLKSARKYFTEIRTK
tara:strand:- start:34 stop:207 length:174 start_codon:yes stop_codon:yes gene_type:complete